MSIEIHTTISSKVIQHYLWKGSFFAILGTSALLIGGIFFSTHILQVWGLFIFVIAISLITYGLLPYRRLCRLQLQPYELKANGREVTYSSKNKKILTLPLDSVSEFRYIQDPIHYGIAVFLQSKPKSTIVVHQHSNEVEHLRKDGLPFGAALFFPFFNRRAYDELVNGTVTKHSN